MENCEDYYIGIKWWVSSCYSPCKIWGDELTFDIIFEAYQKKNQDDYYSQNRGYFDMENSIGNAFIAWSPCDFWDKSSLEFQDSWHDKCNNLVKAKIKNGGDEYMEGTSTWELYYSPSKNPKWCEQKVDSGTVSALESGESAILKSDAVSAHGPGNYMFKAYQSNGHPGKGVLWSEEVEVGG